MPEPDDAALRLRLAELELQRDERDDQINGLITALNEAARRIGELDRDRAAEAYRAEQEAWRFEALRRRRWSRFGAALGAVRRRPLEPGSYRRVQDAVRPRALPPEPAEPPGRIRRPDVKVADTEPLRVPPPDLPDGPVNRPDVVAAVALGPVLETALRYEWTQLDGLRPADWRDVLDARTPALFLAGTAETGLPLEEIAAWCRDRGVPSVYWDTGEGLGDAAAAFDHVCTVDAASVAGHRARLGHDRVHHLPFAAQPRLHNPVRGHDHGRYPLLYEGAYDPAAEPLIAPAPRLGAHFHATGFPHLYRQRVVAPLPYPQALTARKRYKAVLAPGPRLAFEVAAAGVPIVHAGDPETTFGPAVDDQQNASRLLRALLAGPELRDRQAHLALREAHSAHTYRHRVDSLLEHLGHGPAAPRRPAVSLILPTCRAEQLAPAIAQVARQEWRPLQLVLVLHGLDVDPVEVEKQALAAGIDDVAVLTADPSVTLGGCLNRAIDAADGDHIGKIDDDELYGPHYVSDLVPAFGYTEADVVGKLAHYAHLASMNATLLRYPDFEHRYVDVLRGGALLAEGDLMRAYRFADLGRGEDTDLFRRLREDGVRVYAADRFSFVTIRHADAARHTWRPSDLELLADSRVAFYGLAEDHIMF